MCIDDYYRKKEYDEIYSRFINRIVQLSGININESLIFHIRKIIEGGQFETLKGEYGLNEQTIIYDMMCLYSYNASKRKRKSAIFTDPHIISYGTGRKSIDLETIFGDISFRLYIPGKMSFWLENAKKSEYNAIYQGERFGHCHQTALAFAHDDVKCVTSFTNIYVKGLKIAHSYLEDSKNDEVIDISRNLVIDRSTFYSLVEPEVVSALSQEEIIEDWSLINRHPGQGTKTLKPYLIEHDNVMAKVRNGIS